MTIERETIVERPATTETIVTGGSPFGWIGGILGIVIVVVLALWLFGAFNGGSATVDLPTVTVSN